MKNNEKKYGHEKFPFDCPEKIIEKAKEKNCDEIAVKGEWWQENPTNMAGGEGAYYEEIEISSEFVGLIHHEFTPGYGAGAWGKVMFI